MTIARIEQIRQKIIDALRQQESAKKQLKEVLDELNEIKAQFK